MNIGHLWLLNDNGNDHDWWWSCWLVFMMIIIYLGPLMASYQMTIKLAGSLRMTPGMPGSVSNHQPPEFQRKPLISDPGMHHGKRAWRTCRDACRDRLPAVTGKRSRGFPAHAHSHNLSVTLARGPLMVHWDEDGLAWLLITEDHRWWCFIGDDHDWWRLVGGNWLKILINDDWWS